jgi:hypothetical protein
MKIAIRLILLAVVVALGVWLWTVLFPGPEKVIAKRFQELARTVSFTSGESDLTRLGAARKVAGFFAVPVELAVELPELGHHSTLDREEIMQVALAARARAGGVQVRFSDLTVRVAPDKQSAVVDLTAQAAVSGEHDPIVQQMKFTLRKMDGQWLIIRVETVRTLS